MANLRDRGYSLVRIAEQYGIHFSTVSKKIKQVREYDAQQISVNEKTPTN